MRTTFLIMPLALLSFSVFAQSSDCLENICRGNVVLDQYGYRSVVVGIDDLNKSVIYRRDGYSSPLSASPRSLVRSVPSIKFPANKIVLDEYNYTGRVFEAYEDGRISYIRDGYSSTILSRQLSPEVQWVNEFTAGRKIIDSDNYTGTISRVFENHSISYIRTGYSSTQIAKAHSLSVEISMVNDIKIGTRVIDSSDYVGIARQTFQNGKIEYVRDGYSSSQVSTQLVPEVTSINGIAPNTYVLDSNDYSGKVLYVFKDGRMAYRRDGYSSSIVTRSLSAEISRLGELTKGTKVLDGNEYSGRVTAVYENGKIGYVRDGYSSVIYTRSLSHAVDESSKGHKVGMIVVDTNSYLGTVVSIYSNGKIGYKRNGYSNLIYASTLYKEVDSHNRFDKDSRYITSDLIIGKVDKFFENGDILLGSRITKTLYGVASEVDGVMVGSELLNHKGEKIVVDEVFENGAIVHKVDVDGEMQDQVSMMVTAEEIEKKDYKVNAFLMNVINEVEASEENVWRTAGVNIVVKEENIEALKKQALNIFKEQYDHLKASVKKAVTAKLTNGEEEQDSLLSTTTDGVVTPKDVAASILQVVVNKKKHEKVVTDALDKEEVPHVLVAKAGKDAKNVLTISISEGLVKDSCKIDLKFGKSRITDSVKTSYGDIVEDCMEKLTLAIKRAK